MHQLGHNVNVSFMTIIILTIAIVQNYYYYHLFDHRL